MNEKTKIKGPILMASPHLISVISILESDWFYAVEQKTPPHIIRFLQPISKGDLKSDSEKNIGFLKICPSLNALPARTRFQTVHFTLLATRQIHIIAWYGTWIYGEDSLKNEQGDNESNREINKMIIL